MVTATITDSKAVAPVAVAVNATTNTIYVANSQSNNLTVIDGATGTVTATIMVGTSPSGVCLSSQMNFIYVVNSRTHSITVINAATDAPPTLTPPNARNPAAVAAIAGPNKPY